jgi:cell division protein FtsL
MQAQATQLIHAYKQAPWRVQRQYVGAFLLAVVGMSMIAALYLQVTARTAAAGREIQEMRAEIMTAQRANADLETKLAKLTSSAEMQRRALELGYRPVNPGELSYVAVPGFVAPEPIILRAAQDAGLFPHPLPTEYTQSLIEWLNERIKAGGY